MLIQKKSGILGLISTLAILTTYLLVFMLTAFNRSNLALGISNYSIIPLLSVWILYLLVSSMIINPDLKHFKLIVGLLILTRFSAIIIMSLIQLNFMPPDIMTYPLIIVGIIYIGGFIWFLLAISYITKGSLYGQEYLNLYAIFSVLVLIVNAVPDLNIITDSLTSSNINNWIFIANAIPYIFIGVYFKQHQSNMKRLMNTSA